MFRRARRWIVGGGVSAVLAVVLAGGCGARTPLEIDALADAQPDATDTAADASCRRECDGAFADTGAPDVAADARDASTDAARDAGQCCVPSECHQTGCFCATSTECCSGECLGGYCQLPATCGTTPCFEPSQYCQRASGGRAPHAPQLGCLNVPSDCLDPCPTQATCDCIARHQPCAPAGFLCTVTGFQIDVTCMYP